MNNFPEITTTLNYSDIIERNFGHYNRKIFIGPVNYSEVSFDEDFRMNLKDFLDYVKDIFIQIGIRMEFIYAFEEEFLMIKFLGNDQEVRNIVLEKISQLRYMGFPLLVMNAIPRYYFIANILNINNEIPTIDEIIRNFSKNNTRIALDTSHWICEVDGAFPEGFVYGFHVTTQDYRSIRSSRFRLNMDSQIVEMTLIDAEPSINILNLGEGRLGRFASE